MTQQVVICGATAFNCVCDLAPDDHEVHKCRCGGSWRGQTEESEDFEVVTFPNISDPFPVWQL